jgi:hypothetical protein
MDRNCRLIFLDRMIRMRDLLNWRNILKKEREIEKIGIGIFELWGGVTDE